MPRLRCLVRGIGDVGSGVAHTLFRAGHAVAIHGESAPTTHRRLMSFADAVFDGRATLEGVEARRMEAAESIGLALHGKELPIWVGAFETIHDAERWDVLVDARMRKRSVPENQRGLARLTIGLGPGFVAGDSVDVVIETGWDNLGAIIRTGASAPLAGEPREIMGHRRDRLLYAPASGKFSSDRTIGDLVVAGQTIGAIDGQTLAAPLTGAIRGLTRSGIAVTKGTKLVEIDPRGTNAVYTGLGDRPKRIAEAVVTIVGAAT
jgi:xanthine dehydrogenase accessory factor